MSDVMDAVAQTFGEMLGHPAVGTAIRLIALYVVIVWIASAWWVWRDARTRSTDVLVPYLAAGAVILVTPLLFPLAVVIYRMVRPPLTVSAATSVELQMAMLEEEATHSECAACGAIGRRRVGRLPVVRRGARGPMRVLWSPAGARLADLRLVRRGGAVGREGRPVGPPGAPRGGRDPDPTWRPAAAAGDGGTGRRSRRPVGSPAARRRTTSRRTTP